MDPQLSEPHLRREAVRRKLQGEHTCDISQALNRTPQWVNKWHRIYQRNPDTDFADFSRAPHTSPQQTSAATCKAIGAIRKSLESGTTLATRYGLIGNRAVQAKLVTLGYKEIPSTTTIQRILAAQGLTHPIGAGTDQAFYPWVTAWQVNAIHATDIITRHLAGGQVIQNFHTLDHYSHAIALTQYLQATSRNSCHHLLKTWGNIGFPLLQQFDNGSVFCGGPTHPRIIGQVVRLCLMCGIEIFFTPIYEAKRNYQIETFHSLWLRSFWQRHHFTQLKQIQREQPVFLRWHQRQYHPPQLHGLTPAQIYATQPVRLLTTELQAALPRLDQERLPITAGYIHFMRKVETDGHISFLNETWVVGKHWVGEYIRATINTAHQTLSFWHKADETTEWHLLKTRTFTLEEPVHKLLPEFRQNRKRCREQLPV